MVNGNNIFISLDGQTAPFAATKANEIQVDAEKIPISSPLTGEWEQHIVGRKKWSFSINSLVTALADIKQLLMVGSKYTITVLGRSGNDTAVILQGRATCMSARAGLTRGNLANGSFSFDGDGPLIVPVTGISLSPTSLSLYVGDSQPIAATVTPSDASVQQLQWSSSDESVASVDNEGNVTAVGEGTCTITCAATDGSGVKATCPCGINVVLVSQIELTLSSISLPVNVSEQNPVAAIVSPENATNKSLQWTSSNPTNLIVTQNGDDYTIQGIAAGTYQLIASATDGSGVSRSCYVYIT